MILKKMVRQDQYLQLILNAFKNRNQGATLDKTARYDITIFKKEE